VKGDVDGPIRRSPGGSDVHSLLNGITRPTPPYVTSATIATHPDLLLADEPTTALDVTIQDQILDLLTEIRVETGMGMLLVSHDAGVVAQTADEVAVMYAGHLVETGPATDVLATPRHPYTRGLVGAIPSLAARDPEARLLPIPGQPPDLATLPPGCPFAPRCAYTIDACASVPMTLDAQPPGHGSACPFVGRVGA